MERQAVATRDEVVTESLFSLQEPWRARFLTFVAKQAVGWSWDGPPPTRDEVKVWLNNASLCHTVTRLIETWEGTRVTLRD